MLDMLFFATVAAASPVQARLVDVDLQRPHSINGEWYNRINVEFESSTSRQVRLCPDSAYIFTQRDYGDEIRTVDRFPGSSMTVAGQRGQTASCQSVTLGPDSPQRVTFRISGVPGRWRAEDNYILAVEADSTRFLFVEGSDALPANQSP